MFIPADPFFFPVYASQAALKGLPEKIAALGGAAPAAAAETPAPAAAAAAPEAAAKADDEKW